MDRTKSNSAKRFNLSRFLPAVSVFALASACACFTCAAQSVGLYASTATRGDHASDQWAFPKIHLNDAWDITTGSEE